MRFVALDFETTGTDPRQDRIIQVGAVRVEDGRITSKFQSFVKLLGTVPIRVKRLTGICEEHLRDAPSIEDVLAGLIEFIDGDFVAAHNASFEREFLEVESRRAGIQLPQLHYVDTVELARLACPELQTHRLDSLAVALGILLPRHHDAVSDAETCGLLYTRLIERASALGKETLSLVLSVADEGWPLRSHIEAALEGSPQKPFRPAGTDAQGLQPVKPSGKRVSLDPFEMAGLLGPEGPLASQFTAYEYRAEQVQMMALVTEAFNECKHLLVEAGTGTGKSIAYLLPAAKWAITNSDHVIISTHTINLQEQLLRNDIPLITRALGLDLRVALLKGRPNYVCLRRFYELITHGLLSLGIPERRALARIITWLSKTISGDRGEISVFGPAETVWNSIAAKPGSCAASRCPYRERCFVNAVRRKAAASHIIIVNHSLVFSDIASNNKVLPPHTHIVFDEAHHLEDAATLHLGVDLTLGEIVNLVDEWSGHSPAIMRIQRSGPAIKDRNHLLETLARVAAAAAEASRNLTSLGAALSETMALADQEWSGRLCLRIRQRSGLEGPRETLRISAENGIHSIRSLARELASFAACAADETLPSEVLDVAQQAQSGSLALFEAAAGIESVLCLDDDNTVRWLESQPDRAPHSITLRTAPVDVSPLLKDRLFDALDSVVMTSATLSIEGQFEFIKRRLGLDGYDKTRLLEEIIGSPFDYPSQALLCIATDMPPVQSTPASELSKRVSEFIGDLVLETGGRTLVLFTSHRLLQEVYALLKPVCEANDICLLAQGIDGTRTKLIEELRSTDRTVVFGSNSFWEGVDVPGKSLSCVVMVRLPFWPPTMPVVQARQERLERAGQSSFANLSLPEAIIRFKQGFGRLIRTRTDKGCVVVIDQRLTPEVSRYGARFIRSLPGPTVFAGTCREIIERVRDWVGVSQRWSSC